MKGQIEFKGLRLRYQGQEREAVKEIRFEIQSGKIVALVGQVGAGKTTLLHMIARLYNPPAGTLYIDGVDILEIPLQFLRESMGFATQDAVVFSDTVRANVLFGRSGFSEAAVFDALRTVQLLEEVQALEHGLDTILGERGITLSGGQRQRLSLARAVLADPPILILDDALSMVDTRTEERILNPILASRAGKTTLIVSNRVSTIRRADMIVVLEKGMVAEMGDHETLLQTGKKYPQLYERQILAEELEEEGERKTATLGSLFSEDRG